MPDRVRTERALSPDQSPHRYQDTCADKPGNQIAEPSGEHHTEDTEDGISDNRPHDAKNDIHEDASAALHKHLGKPSGKAAYDDCRYPANTCAAHLWSPLLVQAV